MYSIVCVSLSYDTRNVFSLFSVKYMGSCPLNRKRPPSTYNVGAKFEKIVYYPDSVYDENCTRMSVNKKHIRLQVGRNSSFEEIYYIVLKVVPIGLDIYRYGLSKSFLHVAYNDSC
jgi:hypothetical protein